jgi:hypothetical protein
MNMDNLNGAKLIIYTNAYKLTPYNHKRCVSALYPLPSYLLHPSYLPVSGVQVKMIILLSLCYILQIYVFF